MLLDIIKSAINYFTNNKAVVAALKSENATLLAEKQAGIDKIAELQTALTDEDLDDAALQAAAQKANDAKTAAETRAADLQAQLDALNAEGEKLAAAINENPEVPVTDLDLTV